MDTNEYKKRGTDVVGYWSPELGPIHCIPRAAKVFDGNIQAERPSTLIVCELVEPCNAITLKEGDTAEKVTTQKGDIVGIWGKPGMAAIRTLSGEPCLIRYELLDPSTPYPIEDESLIKQKKMKKKGMNPMKMFEVLSKKNPMRVIKVIEDTRDKSAHVTTMLTGPRVNVPAAKPSQQPDSSQPSGDDDDIPF